MAKSNILYYVELVPGNDNFRSYIKSDRPHYTRKSFSEEHGQHVRVNKSVFGMDRVHAEPKKKNTLGEMILSVLIVWAVLNYVPSVHAHLSPARWLMGIALSALFGHLIGKLRMDKQQCEADYFNKS